jgi:hypothetical protein
MGDIYFGSEDTIPCPDCTKTVTNPRKQPKLLNVETNYSGSGRDIGQCPECGHAFGITYAIAKVERWEDFDGLSRAEQQAEERKYALKRAEQLEGEAKKLRQGAL